MNLVDSVHGRVDPSQLPELDALAAKEGRPTTPMYQAMLRLAAEKQQQTDKTDGTDVQKK